MANRGYRRASRFLMLLLGAVLLWMPAGRAQTPTAKLGLITSQSGAFEALYGRPFLDSVRLAVEEANASGVGPRIELEIQDDRSTEDGAREAAARIGESTAIAAVGPVLSVLALPAGPVFEKAGIASIVSTAGSDLVTNNKTTFQTVFRNSDLGESVADYLRFALSGTHAAVIFSDNGYGRTIADGFRRGAERLGLPTTYYAFKTPEERDEAARSVAADPAKPAVVLGMLDTDAAPVMVTLRRAGVRAPVLGPGVLGDPSFVGLFKDLPEERRAPGHFTKGLYIATPVILDSANAETLAFVDRYRARFGPEASISWLSVQGYDAARLAIAAIRAAAAKKTAVDVGTRRDAAFAYLASLNGPSGAVPGLLGPIWFTPERGRLLPIRMGRFSKSLFESAPVQLVPISAADPAEIAAGTVVEIGPGRYARRQQVVYTGIYLNEISRIDIAQSTFTADFYVWVRFARGLGGPDADPTQFEFPDMVRGTFASSRPAGQRDLDDGTTYRLWRISGDFKNDFDLRRYPADRQALDIRFFNARAASDRLVYVLDRGGFESAEGGTAASTAFGGAAAPAAFRNLTQWQPLRVLQARENLVSRSALGDPGLVGLDRVRELSGFTMDIEVQRSVGTTLIKTLLPIGLMTLIMFATLYFPPVLAAAKVTVAITAGLSGAVLLSSINAQLGNVGYVIAVEYGFYVFFALCLVCIITVLVAETWRLNGRSTVAVEQVGRAVFVLGLLGTTLAACIAFALWR